MKYIVYLDFTGLEIPIIFPVLEEHSTMAMRFATNTDKLVSAGFIKLDDSGNLYCTGHSQNLKLKSRPEDIELIKQYLKFRL